ncbi:SRPBCC family protein [Puia dinghuensis]|uniref:Activator of Hsp90 ATPase homologue 1/2-like C-terminal domain-containing protein n=1 Tax=Puia dinghuensis TaxID=1792502 RepID=A0A8J2UCP0_9BACT|nr:SRPBCC family protein [Puia dinghuensis]GGA98952.1 hypothetical protein GCM10011511_22840 [Puia dinghuensis]
MPEKNFTLSHLDGTFFRKGNVFGVRFERILNHPTSVVWKALTDPGALAKWLAPVTIEGDTITLQLTGGTMGGKILNWKKNALLEYVWYEGSIVRWELLTEGEGRCRLVFTHSGVMASQLEGAATGWHYHLDMLRRVLNHDELPASPVAIVAIWESISRDAAARYKAALPLLDTPAPSSFVMERVFDAPVDCVWKALTVRDQIRDWFMSIDGFEPEEGYEFTLVAMNNGKRYVHFCRVTEVIDQRRLTYSFRFQNTNGITFVTWELFPEGEKTRLRLTHEGLERIAHAGADYARQNFVEGWTYFFTKLTQILSGAAYYRV